MTTKLYILQPVAALAQAARLGLGLCILLLLTACASSITTKVTRFNDWPSDAAGSTFSFITMPEKSGDLEQSTYESYVQAELEKLGLKRAAPGRVGRFQASVVTSDQTEERKYRQPVYQDHYVYQPAYRDAAGRLYPGYWTPDIFGPRYVGDREVSQLVSVSTLRLRLLDSQRSASDKPRPVFETRSVYEGARENLPGVVPFLVRAVFEDFPGQNGSVRLVRFDSKTGAVIKD